MVQDKYSENIIMSTEKGKAEMEYWFEKLQRDAAVSCFPKDNRYLEKQDVLSVIRYRFPDDVYLRMAGLCNNSAYAVYILLLSGLKYILCRYSGNQDITVGMPAFKQRLQGEFTKNVLALRTYIEEKDTFRSLLGKVKTTVLEADRNQNFPIGKTAELLDLKVEQDKYRFNTIVQLEQVHRRECLDCINADIVFSFSMESYGLKLEVEYDGRHFSESTINQIITHLIRLLIVALDDTDKRLSEVEILSEDEKNRLLNDFNATQFDYQKGKSINELFEEQVNKTPDNTAVVFETEEISYRRLNELSNNLAVRLREKGVAPDSIVGILAERSIEMIVGILGIIKAGGAYLPIDPKYPEDRIKYMLEDSGTKALLIGKEIETNNLVSRGGAINLIKLDYKELNIGQLENLTHLNKSGDLAYVIYTSGSTGKPKGVLLEHRGIANLKEFFSKEFAITESDRIVQFASSSFDASVWEIFMALLAGASLHIASEEIINDIERFQDFLNKNCISIATLPPVYLANINPDRVKTLRKIITAGSPAIRKHVEKWNKKVEYINAYGPTETTICATSFLCDERINGCNSIPIGKPIMNCRILILDKNKRLVPEGVAGELCISGDMLARGYLNRPELTAEKFTCNPYFPNERMYHTGDLARWLPDGSVEFLGRIDHQVKIRGYRIEPGEIEAMLLKHEDISEALVITREDRNGDKYLCAYIVAERRHKVKELKDYLAKELPDYMIPAFIIQIADMPLTRSGKIDRNLLPQPDTGIYSGNEYIAPRDETEDKLASVWGEVLGLERVSIIDNFFELGGDSIKAIQVLSRLSRYHLKLEIRDLFQHKTIEQLAKVVVNNAGLQIDQGPVNGEVLLTPIQNWFFENNFKDMNQWNQAVMLRGKQRLNPEVVERVFKKIVEHHDALRIVYKYNGESVLQYNQDIDEIEDVKLQVYDLTNDEEYIQRIEEHANLIQKSISLDKGLLIKLALFKITDRDTLQEEDHLLIVIHHLVIDAVSWRIILEDFATGYFQAEKDEQIIFQAKTHSFMEWSSNLSTYAKGKKIKKESEFWRSIDSADMSSLPVDFENEDSKVKNNQTLELLVSEEYTQKLLKKINKAYNTEIIDILITALGLAIKEWTKQDKVLISLEGHGREAIIEGMDITRTVGWFTSLYPVLLNINVTDNISYIIKSVKETIRRIPDKGIGYGILRYLESEEARSPIFSYTPEIGFNYFGQVEQDINTNLFGLSPFSVGQAMSSESQNNFKININGIIKDGRLTIAIIYNQLQYKKNTILKLVESYERYLKNIIDHCDARNKTELTPYDVGCSELSIEEFERIYNVWGNGINKIYRLMPTQQGMLFHTIMDETSHTYFQQIVFEIHGDIDLQLLTRSFNTIIERHEVLRTNFIYKQVKSPVQIVLQEKPVDMYFEDITEHRENKNSFIEEFKVKDRNKGFNLEKDALIRLSVLKTDKECYKLVWSFHHILMDGWCIGIISKELFEIYNALKKDIPLALGKAPAYSEYVEWYKKQDEEEARAYWTHYLEGYENKAVIPKLVNRGQAGRFEREEFSFIISKEITDKLSNIATKNNATLNIVLQALWGILLQRYNDNGDVVFGAVMSGRRAEVEGIEEMLGLFINTVPVRVCCDRSLRFNDLLEVMQENAILSEKYSYYPLVEIQENSLLKNELFDSIMVFENYPLERTSFGTGEDEGLGFAMNFEEAFQQTNYDFNITMFPGEEIGVKITFDSSTYDLSFIKNIEVHLKNAIDTIIENSESAVSTIDILSNREKIKLLVDFNDTKTDDTGYETISRLFEEQAKKTPDNTAVVYGNRHITYKELNGKAYQLAGLLKEKAVGKDCIVGMLVEPSVEMIIGILGVLKAGGAYLPIDPGLPGERISQIVTNSGTKLLLSQNNAISKEYAINTEIIYLDDENTYCGELTNADTAGKQDNLVYVIYTSGTTGVPKGVLIENKGLVNYVKWFSKWVELTSSDKTVLLSSYAFDLGYTALYSSLLNGCELHLLKKEEYANPETLINYIEENKITYIKATPSLFNIIVNNRNFNGARLDQSLRLVALGGEKINNEDVLKFHNKYEAIAIINHYGPTETTIGAIACKIDFKQMEYLNQGPIIGKPISNTQVYILDESLKPVPTGVPGEIYISGPGLARGYLNRPDISKDRFIQNPFSLEFNSMYKTGDLGRFMKNGDIEFLGRKDNQVKIRGYRLEPEEIEANLLEIKNIKDAVVVARDDKNGSKYLCAYIVQETEQAVSEIRAQLIKRLPDYMIPSYFVTLEKWPLTPNGKVDRKALPLPGRSINTGTEYRPPENEVEKILIGIWQEVLGVDEIGSDHNFFEMGGHSLKLINLIARIFETFDVELSPRQVFETPTIRETAACLMNGEYKNPHPLMLLNSEKDKKIFFFPPVGGYGLVYKNLADILEDYSCYSFNYIEDSGSRLSMYVDYMTEVQKKGPYVLMGWSAGGNLAFEVAKELESKGHNVSDVILVDTHRIINNSNLSEEQIRSMVSENLRLAEQDEVYKEYLGRNEFIKARVANKMEDYFTYLRNKMKNSGRLESDIHIIMSTDNISPEQDLRNDWNEATSGSFKKYQGFGSHPYMLYTGFVEENSRIVREILTKASHEI